ncbi:MAG: DUF1493 family protein [Hyphomicrobium sp.]
MRPDWHFLGGGYHRCDRANMTARVREMGKIKEDEPPLCQFLKRIEYSDAQIERMQLDTRLLQDLHLQGDNLLDTLELMHKDYGVDFANFDWRRYTPSEGARLAPMPLILWLLGKYRRAEDYEPLTLGTVAAALRNKTWHKK